MILYTGRSLHTFDPIIDFVHLGLVIRGRIILLLYIIVKKVLQATVLLTLSLTYSLTEQHQLKHPHVLLLFLLFRPIGGELVKAMFVNRCVFVHSLDAVVWIQRQGRQITSQYL